MLDKLLNACAVAIQSFLNVLTNLVLSESQDLHSSISYVEQVSRGHWSGDDKNSTVMKRELKWLLNYC